MQAVIMAAGKGMRLGELTKNTPKPLLNVAGKSIIEHIFSALPDVVDEVIIVVGYLGEKIRDRVGKKFDGIRISYVEQKKLLGTAHALWCAKYFLKSDRFLVFNGDDIYHKDDVKLMLKCDLAIGACRQKNPDIRFLSSCVLCRKDGMFRGFYKPSRKDLAKGVFVVSGPYLLDKRIFEYKPVRLKSGEYGLPSTILSITKESPVKVFEVKKWFPIAYPEDIKKANKLFKT